MEGALRPEVPCPASGVGAERRPYAWAGKGVAEFQGYGSLAGDCALRLCAGAGEEAQGEGEDG